MLTPAFDLTQDDNFVIVSIHIPYTKVSEAEVWFEDYDFKFYCKPYFLKLKLPRKVVFCDEPSVTHNIDTGIMLITVPKATPGESFEGLDLLTQLLAPKGQPSSYVPKIEIIGNPCCPDEEDFDWEIEQPTEESLLLNDAKCGFANMYTCVVFRLKEETTEIFDIVDPDKKSAMTRREERLQAETAYFSDDYYLDNLYNNEEIQQVLAFKPDWENLSTRAHSSSSENINQNVHFTSEEKERLRRLPNKEYLLDKSETKILLLGLIDILFAFAYNVRTTMGENTVESAWTINKLSATLSSLESFTSVENAAKNCMRRSLCYPLFRNWDLTKAVLSDTITILSLGQKYVLKCFLEIHELFCHSEPRFLLNDLYITDYCVWIQGKSCRSKMLRSLAEVLEKIMLSKQDMNLDLEELECGARLALAENAQSNQLPQMTSNLHTNDERSQSSSSESSTDDDTDTSSATGSDYTDSSASDDSESDSNSSCDSCERLLRKNSERQR